MNNVNGINNAAGGQPPSARSHTLQENRQVLSPWERGGLGPKELVKRLWRQIEEDDVFGRAAELSYYFFLAVFPLLFFLLSMLGFVAHGNPLFEERLVSYLGTVMPSDATSLVSRTLGETMTHTSETKLVLGLLAALWAASSGMKAVMNMCNITYDVKEERPFWKTQGLAVMLTIAASVLMISALALVLLGPAIADAIFGSNPVGVWFWEIVQWTVVVFFVLVFFALIYYFGPDVEHPHWRWLSPGSAFGLALWLLASFAFRIYLHCFNSYSATYGSLGAVIILLEWIYLTGAAVMIGSELNAEIEHAAAERGLPEAKLPGEKRAGRMVRQQRP
jgi:membrane protein